MVTSNWKCPIWGVDCTVSRAGETGNVWRVQNSFRAGGDYEFTHEARFEVGDLEDDVKARLTSILVEQWMKGLEIPRLTADDVQHAKSRSRLPMLDRAERVLRLLVSRSSYLGDVLDFIDPNDRRSLARGLDTGSLDTSHFEHALAWSECISSEDLSRLTNYLAQRGWIEKGREIYSGNGHSVWRTDGLFACVVDVSGYSLIEDIQTNPDSSQCFVAMWFDDSMNKVFRNGIEPAIRATGFSPFRIDQEDFVGKIDDRIVAEIRRSRFIVADFTHGDDGARGGVYYEAGYAEGHGLNVIFTCRNDMIDKVHFDTRQFNHIVWENPEDLRKRLENRIRRVIGEGPNRIPVSEASA